MQGVAAMVEAWLTQRRTGAIARVIAAEGLGPRPSDDLLIVDVNGRTGGSLLAGAAQPEVIAAAQGLLDTTDPHVVLSLDIDSVDATAAGLTCGGVVDILACSGGDGGRVPIQRRRHAGSHTVARHQAVGRSARSAARVTYRCGAQWMVRYCRSQRTSHPAVLTEPESLRRGGSSDGRNRTN